MIAAQNVALKKASQIPTESAVGLALIAALKKAGSPGNKPSPQKKLKGKTKPAQLKSVKKAIKVEPTPNTAGTAYKSQAPANDSVFKQPKKRLVTLNHELVTIAFHCFSKDVTKGVQITNISGGVPTYTRNVGEQGIVLDLGNFLSRASVDDVRVFNNQGHCTVYLNCIVGPNKDGLGFWGKKHGNKPYDEFIHELTRCTWGKISIKEDNKKTSISLRDYSYSEIKEVLRFAIK